MMITMVPSLHFSAPAVSVFMNDSARSMPNSILTFFSKTPPFHTYIFLLMYFSILFVGLILSCCIFKIITQSTQRNKGNYIKLQNLDAVQTGHSANNNTDLEDPC